MNMNWIDAASKSDVPEEDVIGVDVAGRDIALYSVEGEIYATDNICTHGHARLCDGFLEGHEIECPLHQGRFDVRTGQRPYSGSRFGVGDSGRGGQGRAQQPEGVGGAGRLSSVPDRDRNRRGVGSSSGTESSASRRGSNLRRDIWLPL